MGYSGSFYSSRVDSKYYIPPATGCDAAGAIFGFPLFQTSARRTTVNSLQPSVKSRTRGPKGNRMAELLPRYKGVLLQLFSLAWSGAELRRRQNIAKFGIGPSPPSSRSADPPAQLRPIPEKGKRKAQRVKRCINRLWFRQWRILR